MTGLGGVSALPVWRGRRAPLALLLHLLAGTAGLLPAPARAAPPNFLLFVSDDHSAADSRVYGNPGVATPHLDALAAEGMRFERAFTPTAMCSPSRSSLFTGLYPVRHGAWPNHGRIRDGIETLPQVMARLGYRVGQSGKRHVSPLASFPFEQVPPDRIGAFLEGREPWLLVVATSLPHYPWQDGAALAPAPASVRVPPDLVDTPATRRALAAYYGEVSEMDVELGGLLARLDAAGRRADTVVIYTSDHGAQFPFHKWTCYEGGLRVPFVVRWPDHVRAGSVSDALIDFVDVLPTLVDLAGGQPAADLDGRSFAAVLRGEARRHHDFVYGVHTTRGVLGGDQDYPIRSIRGERWKYIRNLAPDTVFQAPIVVLQGSYWQEWRERAKHDPHAAERVRRYQVRPVEELYDLASDPYELHDLADVPALASVKADLSQRLDAFMRDQGDRGLATERQAVERQHKPPEDAHPLRRMRRQNAGQPPGE